MSPNPIQVSSGIPLLVDCPTCHTPLRLPPGARKIRCALCLAVTSIAGSHALPPPPYHSFPSSNHHPPPPFTSPYNHAPPVPPPSVHGRKRAVICAVSYKRSRQELKGCINDAKCMKYLLVNKFSFPESSIVMLTEEEADPSRHPSKKNMRTALFWLLQGCQAGDSLVFHYSGHGSRRRNYTGDEVDGFDETLCPLDYETQGMIVDDEINATIVRPLPTGARLHAIVDACYSGTVLDLPYLCRMDRNGRYVWEDHRPRSGVRKGTNGGEVFSFSGCDDDQTAADASALSNITWTGAMTYAFIQAIERGHGNTYGNMLNAMRSGIPNTDNDVGRGIVTSLISMLLTGGSVRGSRQEPQLTANQPFDVYTKPFFL